mgnify:FL=1
MKKLFTLMAAVLMAASVNAQTETPLVLGGGWNAGFAGEADVYDFTISKQWGAAEFACNVNSADYPKFILEFEEPLPANCQVNYTWKASADAEGDATPAYGRAVGDGSTKKFELAFDQEHPYIVGVSVQHTDAEEVNLKVKKLTLVGADGSEKQVDPTFTGWAGTDNTISYKGVVSFDKLYQQLAINGLAGKSNVTVKVKLAEPTPNVQMCVDYEGDIHEWPSFNGSDETTITTKEDAVIKTMGIQYIDPENNPVKVSVLGAWLIDTTTGISNIENVKLQDGKCFNLAGQQVAKGYKGIVIKNGKKMVIK